MEWNRTLEQCTWASNFPCDNQLKSYANLSQSNWDHIITFLLSLKWKLVDNGLTAYIELAYAFWHAGLKLDNLADAPEAYSKLPETSNVPGVQVDKCKSVGRTLPAGCISGGVPYINQDALKLLAFRTSHGRSQFLRDWWVPFGCLTSIWCHLVGSFYLTLLVSHLILDLSCILCMESVGTLCLIEIRCQGVNNLTNIFADGLKPPTSIYIYI